MAERLKFALARPTASLSRARPGRRAKKPPAAGCATATVSFWSTATAGSCWQAQPCSSTSTARRCCRPCWSARIATLPAACAPKLNGMPPAHRPGGCRFAWMTSTASCIQKHPGCRAAAPPASGSARATALYCWMTTALRFLPAPLRNPGPNAAVSAGGWQGGKTFSFFDWPFSLQGTRFRVPSAFLLFQLSLAAEKEYLQHNRRHAWAHSLGSALPCAENTAAFARQPDVLSFLWFSAGCSPAYSVRKTPSCWLRVAGGRGSGTGRRNRRRAVVPKLLSSGRDFCRQVQLARSHLATGVKM